jgi:hypothetical protein
MYPTWENYGKVGCNIICYYCMECSEFPYFFGVLAVQSTFGMLT